MPLPTMFFAYNGTVARILRDKAGTSVAIYSVDRWVDSPGIFGYLTGLGGDPPADEISRDQAKQILELVDQAPKEPPASPGHLCGF